MKRNRNTRRAIAWRAIRTLVVRKRSRKQINKWHLYQTYAAEQGSTVAWQYVYGEAL